MYGKTPSSLKWLIDKQTRLAGQMLRKQDHLARLREQVAACKKEIAGLRTRRQQVEAVMRMHEIKIKAEELRPIRPHYNLCLLGHGGLTRLIYSVLRQSASGTATTRDIVAAVFNALPSKSSPDPDQIEHVKVRVRVRLCIMARKGLLMWSPDRGPCEPCSWRLAMVHPRSP